MKVVIEGKIDNFICKNINEGMVLEGDFNATDSYHSFQELYAHRIVLFLCLMKFNKDISWKSRLHSDGTSYGDWFLAGMTLPTGDVSYHIPNQYWGMIEDIKILERAPVYDGYTSEDVIRRLNNWCFSL